MESGSDGLLFAVLCLGFSCLVVAVVAGVFGITFWYFRRSGRRLNQPLASWTNDSLTDLSFRTLNRWSRSFGNLSLYGHILPASNDNAPGLVEFSVNIRGQWTTHRGRMQAKTSLQTFDYAIAPEGVDITVGGSSLGSLQPDGTLVDAAGRTLGRAPRHDGQPFLPPRKELTEPGYDKEVYPVILGERIVATIANPVGKDRKQYLRAKGPASPAVTLLESPREEGANWILALALLQIAEFNLPGTASAMGAVTQMP